MCLHAIWLPALAAQAAVAHTAHSRWCLCSCCFGPSLTAAGTLRNVFAAWWHTRHPKLLLAFCSKRAGRSGAARRRGPSEQKCDPASSNQTHERERADDLKPYGLNRREAREPAPRPQCGPLLLHTPIEAEAFLRASDEQRIYKLQPKPKRPCRFTFLISVVLMHVGHGGDATS